MIEYHEMRCEGCGKMIPPRPRSVERPKRAKSYASCVFRCDCGTGYSNASDPADRRRIMRQPEDNVPREVRAGLTRVLANAANERNRPAKRESFCSAFSEDAVTWTVFSFLSGQSQLGLAAELLGLEKPVGKPAVCLWGAALDDSSASQDLSTLFEQVSRSVGEADKSRSEPDVALAWSDLVILIEVKHTSDNPVQADYHGFGRYLDDPDMWAAPLRDVESTGYYELVRNWRLGLAVANVSKSRFGLMNLGPSATRKSAECFAPLLRTSPDRVFRHVEWSQFLLRVPNIPDWLTRFLKGRGLDPS